jgi:hypothetical protein
MPHTFEEAGRYSLFADVMRRDSSPLGFEYDKARLTAIVHHLFQAHYVEPGAAQPKFARQVAKR